MSFDTSVLDVSHDRESDFQLTTKKASGDAACAKWAKWEANHRRKPKNLQTHVNNY
jgi:hypothetical protein